MLLIAFEGPVPARSGEVLNGELRAGAVLTVRDGTAMAMTRLDRMEGCRTQAQ